MKIFQNKLFVSLLAACAVLLAGAGVMAADDGGKPQDPINYTSKPDKILENYKYQGRTAQPFTEANFSLEDPRQDIINRLNLGSFRSSFGPRIPESGKLYITDPRENLTIILEEYAFYPMSIEMQSYSKEYQKVDWYYNIYLVGAGDWTGDGRADLMIAFTDDATMGTYATSSLLLLEAPDPDGDIIAHDLEEY